MLASVLMARLVERGSFSEFQNESILNNELRPACCGVLPACNELLLKGRANARRQGLRFHRQAAPEKIKWNPVSVTGVPAAVLGRNAKQNPTWVCLARRKLTNAALTVQGKARQGKA
jgi:hypothetical protein